MIEKRKKRVKIQYRICRCSKEYSISSYPNRLILSALFFCDGLFSMTREPCIFIQFRRIFFCQEFKVSRCLSPRRLGSIEGRSVWDFL